MGSHDGRFAPSPTGTLHLGNLRTALLAWLFARGQDARFLMRIEDLDTGRVREHFEAEQLADLAALGLDWDGPVVRQSERSALYAEALEPLSAAGLLYECWCTRAEIREAASAPHGALPEGHYPGTCRRLTAAQRAERERRAGGRRRCACAPTARHRGASTTAWPARSSGVVDDFVVRRNDGAFAYNLAVVVDDAEQGVGEVVRGDDLLDSTPRQLWLGGQLGLPAPRHAHVPLCSAPTARAWPSATARSRSPTAPRRARAPTTCAPSSPRRSGWPSRASGPRPRELVARFDPPTLAAAAEAA